MLVEEAFGIVVSHRFASEVDHVERRLCGQLYGVMDGIGTHLTGSSGDGDDGLVAQRLRVNVESATRDDVIVYQALYALVDGCA